MAWTALVVMLLATGMFLLDETRGTTLWRDDWTFALERRGNNLGTFLEPHDGHFSLVPIAIYRLLFATVGLSDYLPYRVVVISLHLLCVVLLYVYAARRVGSLLGFLVATLLLFFGPAAQSIIWPFQIGWLISLGAGLGALLLLDRDQRMSDVGASLLLAVSLASSGIGIPVAVGLVVDVLWVRRRWRDVWIVAAPLAPYGVWWLVYHTNQTGHWREDVYLTPSWLFSAPADAISSLLGLGGPTTIGGPQTPLAWGAPLMVAALAVAIWRLGRMKAIPLRVLTVLAVALSFWTLTALGRAFFDGPSTGRYLYVNGLLVLLLAVEIARGVSVPRRTGVLLAAAVAAVVVSNVGAFRDAASGLRLQAGIVRTELGVLDVTRPIVKPGFVPEAFLFDEVHAGPYFSASDALGTPAATPAEISTQPEPIRLAADAEFIRIHLVALHGSSTTARLGRKPTVDSVAGGSVTVKGACVSFSPAVFTPSGRGELEITAPPAGLLIRAGGAGATVSVRRFADGFSEEPVGAVATSGSAVLRISPDLARQPWHVRLAFAGRPTVCGLR